MVSQVRDVPFGNLPFGEIFSISIETLDYRAGGLPDPGMPGGAQVSVSV